MATKGDAHEKIIKKYQAECCNSKSTVACFHGNVYLVILIVYVGIIDCCLIFAVRNITDAFHRYIFFRPCIVMICTIGIAFFSDFPDVESLLPEPS